MFFSCIKIGVKCKPIQVKELIGTFDLLNGETITFKNDYTYEHLLQNDSTVYGIWIYQSFEALRINEILGFDMRAFSEIGENKYYTRYLTFRFYACKHWGNIIITRGPAGDPDGAPRLIWFKKIK